MEREREKAEVTRTKLTRMTIDFKRTKGMSAHNRQITKSFIKKEL